MRKGSIAEDNAISVKSGHNKNPNRVGSGWVFIQNLLCRAIGIPRVWYLTGLDWTIQGSDGTGRIMESKLSSSECTKGGR